MGAGELPNPPFENEELEFGILRFKIRFEPKNRWELGEEGKRRRVQFEEWSGRIAPKSRMGE